MNNKLETLVILKNKVKQVSRFPKWGWAKNGMAIPIAHGDVDLLFNLITNQLFVL